MALRTKLELEWNNKKYSLVVNMGVIDRIDAVLSVSILSYRLGIADIRLAQLAKFISLVLNEAGADTTQESVYEQMFEDGNESMQQASELAQLMLSAFFVAPKKKDITAKSSKTKK